MLAPGDEIQAQTLPDESVLVERVFPRTSILERRNSSGRSKILAANVDTLITVTALADPPPRLLTLDQLLAFADLQRIGAAIVFTKPDLASEREYVSLAGIYEALGYQVLAVNPKTGSGLDALRTGLREKRALLCGVSGVGKSSIFRQLGGDAVVGDLSRHGLGRQTTTSARLHRTESGFLIDSPGIADFGLGRIPPAELAQGFREVRRAASSCRFTDCTHLREPGCAIIAAVAAGLIAQSRYDGYRKILGYATLAPVPGNQ